MVAGKSFQDKNFGANNAFSRGPEKLMSTQAMVVLSTAPDEAIGSRIAAALVEKRLAACVNIIAGVRSLYWWEGKVQDDAEVLLICKTDDAHVDELTAVLEEMHPYDCPEVVALPVLAGSAAYLRWIGESLAH